MNDRHLILLRHAKSSWENASQSDFDRPLNERGRKAAPWMGEWLEQNSMVPDCILCSTAVRAQETADLVSATWRPSPSRIDLQELYLASPPAILAAIKEFVPSKSRSLLVVGHNPGLEDLASRLSGSSITMPTAAIAIFRITESLDWSIDVSDRRIRLVRFIVPRDLHSALDSD